MDDNRRSPEELKAAIQTLDLVVPNLTTGLYQKMNRTAAEALLWAAGEPSKFARFIDAQAAVLGAKRNESN